MDGTLIDSNDALEVTWQRWAAERGVAFEHIRRVHHGRLPAETISIVAPHLDAAAEARLIYAEQDAITEGIHPIAGANDFFRSVPAHRAAIVTAATLRILHRRLRLVGIDAPTVCVTADSVRCGKPDPEGYLDAARRLGYEPQACVVFEDAPTGLVAAHRAGMRAVGILSNYTEAGLRAELGAGETPVAFIRDFRGVTLDGTALTLPG